MKMEQLNMKRGQINQIINDYKNKTKQLYTRLKQLNDKYLRDNNNNIIDQNQINDNNPQIINSLVVIHSFKFHSLWIKYDLYI